MFKKLKELWNRFDIWMMMNPGKNPYIWDLWERVKSPTYWLAVLLIIYFFLHLYPKHIEPNIDDTPPRETITIIYENGKHIIIK